MRKLITYYKNIQKEDKVMFFLQLTAIGNVIVATVKLAMALTLPSLWFFINACFLFVIILARSFSIRDYNRNKKEANILEKKKRARKNYLNNGIILIALGIVYFCVSLYMMFRGAKVNMHEYLTYLTALIAFWSIGSAIYGMVKYKAEHSPIIKAVKITNFSYALTSIVLTQVVLLNAFSGGFDAKLYNGMTGMAASAVLVGLGIYMITDIKRRSL